VEPALLIVLVLLFIPSVAIDNHATTDEYEKAASSTRFHVTIFWKANWPFYVSFVMVLNNPASSYFRNSNKSINHVSSINRSTAREEMLSSSPEAG
jgi:lipopolysaccharide export LptBFGC system permease protein LptF